MSWIESRASEKVRGLDLFELKLDEAYLNVTSRLQKSTWLYSLRAACDKCSYERVASLPPDSQHILKLNSQFSWKFRIFEQDLGVYSSSFDKSSLICEVNQPWKLGEFGVYDLAVTSAGQGQNVMCHTSTFLEPVNIYLPIALLMIIGISFISLLLISYWAFSKLRSKVKGHDLEVSSSPEGIKVNQCQQSTGRLRSAALDTFRGFCLVMLMFYNGGGGGYGIFEHTAWDGLPIADIPFPWFLWIMGACIPISVNSALKRNISRWTIMRAITIRSIALFLAGLLVSSVDFGPQLETFRLFGVLQRFGLLCFICGGICAALWPRNIHQVPESRWRDLKATWTQWLVHVCLHVTHLILTFMLQVPGCPTGYLGPGGLDNDMKHVNCTGGVVGYIDKLLISENHMYPNATSMVLYQTQRFEPEGTYSSLPALMTVMLGIQAGSILILNSKWKTRVQHWSVWGAVSIVIASLLEVTGTIPVNKNLWSTSFSLATGGLAFFALALIYMAVDVKRFFSGAPMTYLGMNSIILYLGSKVSQNIWPWHWRLGNMDTHFMLLLDTCWSVLLWILIALLLHKKGLYLKL